MLVLPDNLIGHKIHMLKRWSNLTYGYYGVPVYLVGSALVKEDPRDYDIRVEFDDDMFKQRFKCDDVLQWILKMESGLWDKSNFDWSDENVKRTKHGWRFTELNIDFQIYPTSLWISYNDKPRLRLDGIMEIV